MNIITEKYISIVGGAEKIYVIEVQGKNASKNSEKTLLVTAGIHGAEYPGIKALLELKKELENIEIQGRLLMVPVVNEQAFYEYSRFVSPQDGKNLNRAFPGKKVGSFTERLAYTLEKELFSVADFYLDLHSGDSSELVMPFAYVPGLANEATLKKSIDATTALNLPIWVKSRSTVGSFNHAANLDIPAILVERGGQGLCKAEDVMAYKADIKNLLAYLQLTEGNFIKYAPKGIEQACYTEAERAGCWNYLVEAGEIVKAGQLLGRIETINGKIVQEVVAEFYGRVLYLTTTFGVQRGEPLIAYGVWEK